MNPYTEKMIRQAEGLRGASQSIHPHGRKGTNMSKPRRQSTIDRAISGIEKHLGRHPNDGVQKAYLDKLSKMTGV